MRRFLPGIAIALLTFTVGIFAAQRWLMSRHATPAPVSINLPPVKPPPAAPKPPGITQGRNLSLYDQGGHQGCGYGEASEARCKASYKKARDFIWTHWQEQKRGYVIVRFGSVDAVSDSHIFIEPDESGAWQVVWRIERVVSFENPGMINDVPDLRSVERGEAGRSDFQEAGTPILIFKDKNGKVIETL